MFPAAGYKVFVATVSRYKNVPVRAATTPKLLSPKLPCCVETIRCCVLLDYFDIVHSNLNSKDYTYLGRFVEPE